MAAFVNGAKASNLEDRSDAIIVSFDARWYDALRNGKIGCIIRKRIPRDRYEWLYFHVNSPVGAICGRARIDNARTINLSEAIKLANAIGLSAKDIAAYVGSGNSIGCYKVYSFEIAKSPQRTAEIKKKLNYSPPQSFLILSKTAKHIIDEMSDFCRVPVGGAKS